MKEASIRDKNFIWALAEDYDLNISKILLDCQNGYEKIIYSSLYMTEDYDMLEIYMEKLYRMDESKDILKLFVFAYENFILDYLIEKRPVVESYRRNYYLQVDRFFNHHQRRGIYQEILYCHSSYLLNKFAMATRRIKSLHRRLVDFSKLESIDQLIDKFTDLVDQYFHLSYKEARPSSKRIRAEAEKKKGFDYEDKLDDYYGLIGSAEFTSQLDLENMVKDDRDLKGIHLRDEDLSEDQKYRAVQTVFGKSIIDKDLKKLLEKQICTGRHSSSKLLFTRQEYGDDPESSFNKRKLDRARRENLDHFNFKKHSYRRQEKNMNKQILNSLIVDSDYSLSNHNHGKLIPARIYRALYLNDHRIFEKKLKNNIGRLSVDILLDSSASQTGRKEKIAAQAYVISQAFTKANIPTRVMSFSNIENYMGFNFYRDYQDLPSDNKRIFNYLPKGSNRDGLALRIVGKLLEDSPYETKLFIYLTDGLPNDVRQRVDNKMKNYEVSYEGQFAQMDTASEFRKLDFLDIKSLAVFTGERKDLEKMKKIYGHNFVYIDDINRFSKIISEYMKKIMD